MTNLSFEKWQSLGNDYIIIESNDLTAPLTAKAVRQLCDRHRGIGADGIAVVNRAAGDGFRAALRIYNPDGSEAELSGNAVRQAGIYLYRKDPTLRRFALSAPAGEVTVEVISDQSCRIDIGRARLSSEFFPTGAIDGRGEISIDGETLRFQHCCVGNPQSAVRLQPRALEQLDLERIGSLIANDPRFPMRTNVSFWTPIDDGSITAKIYERGVGPTEASGTGACGAALAFVLDGGDSRVRVSLPGGELIVTIDEALGITLQGPAERVFAGEVFDFEAFLT